MTLRDRLVVRQAELEAEDAPKTETPEARSAPLETPERPIVVKRGSFLNRAQADALGLTPKE